MRHLWVDLDAPVQTEKVRAAGITRVYFDAREQPRQAPAGLERGIYRAQSWDDAGPKAFAQELSADVARWGGDPGRQLAVHANVELHDPDWLVSFLNAWLRMRPVRETALVVEGLQGGWFTPALTGLVNRTRSVCVLAEAYTGDMRPIDPDDVRSNLINYGIARGKAAVMYDAGSLGPFWDGCAFTQQRLA